jgi:nitronate monooxygenase
LLTTDFTRLFGIEHPLVQAGMANESGAPLAAAVSNAGALGTVGSIGRAPDQFAAELEACRRTTNRPFAANVVTWDWSPWASQLLEVALRGGSPIITLSFGDPLPALERCRALGRKVIVQVQDLAGARAAVEAGVDAIMVQGNEAGGHTGRRGTLSFAAQVLDFAGDIPVLIAGGVANGRGLAAALAMGAAGAVMGTRFKATVEFGASGELIEAEKRQIVASDGSDTVYDEINDDAISMSWPNGVTGRALRSPFTDEWLGRREELKAAVAAAGQPSGFVRRLAENGTPINWAGESAGLVDEILPAAEVVARTVREAEEFLARAAGLLPTATLPG